MLQSLALHRCLAVPLNSIYFPVTLMMDMGHPRVFTPPAGVRAVFSGAAVAPASIARGVFIVPYHILQHYDRIVLGVSTSLIADR